MNFMPPWSLATSNLSTIIFITRYYNPKDWVADICANAVTDLSIS